MVVPTYPLFLVQYFWTSKNYFRKSPWIVIVPLCETDLDRRRMFTRAICVHTTFISEFSWMSAKFLDYHSTGSRPVVIKCMHNFFKGERVVFTTFNAISSVVQVFRGLWSSRDVPPEMSWTRLTLCYDRCSGRGSSTSTYRSSRFTKQFRPFSIDGTACETCHRSRF